MEKECRHCGLYRIHQAAALSKHERSCWANPMADGKKNTDFSCIACGERLTTKVLLADHRREHHSQVKEQRCRHCRREWNTTDIWRAIHEGKCHQNPGSTHQHPCSHCRRRFPGKEELKRHSAQCRGGAIIEESVFHPTDTSSEESLGIYTITAPSGKSYLGMTARMGFSSRWKLHRKQLRSNTHHCLGLQSAYFKYGEDSLIYTTLEEYAPVAEDLLPSLESFLLRRERELWDALHAEEATLYNGRPTGTGSVHHDEESRERRRMAAYLASNSSRPIWNRICVSCGDQYTTGKKSRFTCFKEECNNTALKAPSRDRKTAPPLHRCAGNTCSNYISPEEKYCGFSCSYTQCLSPLCCNYVPRDRRGGTYCNRACKRGRGELNPTLLAEMHHDRGMSTRAIGRLLGYSAVAVQLCMERHGVERRSYRRTDPDPSAQELHHHYVEEGESLRSMARRYGVQASTIKGWLTEANIPLRGAA